MSIPMSALRSAVLAFARSRGVVAENPDVVARVPDRDAVLVRLRFPRLVETVEIDQVQVYGRPETVIDQLDAGVERLFASVQRHIAEHGDTRVRQLEGALREAMELLAPRMIASDIDTIMQVGRLGRILEGQP